MTFGPRAGLALLLATWLCACGRIDFDSVTDPSRACEGTACSSDGGSSDSGAGDDAGRDADLDAMFSPDDAMFDAYVESDVPITPMFDADVDARADADVDASADAFGDAMDDAQLDVGADAAVDTGSDALIVPFCGDGHIDPGEECDDANVTGTDGCTNDCHAAGTCAVPVSLDGMVLGDGTVFYAGNTSGHVSERSSVCGSSASSDIVFSYTPPANGRIEASTEEGAGRETVLSAMTTCGGAESACNVRASGSAYGSRIEVSATAGVPVYLVVDGPAAGAFNLRVRFSASPEPGTCDAPLDFNALSTVQSDGSRIYDGSTAHTFDDSSGTCSGTPGDDQVFVYTPTSTGRIEVSTEDFAGRETVVYAQSSCGGPELACNVRSNGSAYGSRIAVDVTEGVPLYLVVDSNDTRGRGAFSLRVRAATAPESGSCALPLDFNALSSAVEDGSRIYTGSTSYTFDDSAGTCSGSPGDDVVFVYTPPSNGRIEASTESGAGRETVLYARSSCSGPELACNVRANGSAYGSRITANVTGGVPIYLVVDSNDTRGRGAFNLVVRHSPLPEPGTCATPLDFNALSSPQADGTRLYVGSTTYTFDDSSGTCSGSPGDDLVFAYTPPSDGRIEVSTEDFAGRETVVYAQSACGGPELACNVRANGSAYGSRITVNVTAGVPVYLIVDSNDSRGRGSFFMRLFHAPSPENGTCAAPRDFNSLATLQPDGTHLYAGSSTHTFDDTSGSCSGSPGDDVVFIYTPTATGIATFSTQDGASRETVLYARSACGGAELACNVRFGGSAYGSRISVPVTAGVPIYVIVDSNDSRGRGTFNLRGP